MNCKPDPKAAKREYDRQRYQKSREQKLHAGWVPGPNQWSIRHRMTGTPEYKTWQSMKRRCLVTHDKDYPSYGGRGITICDEWVRSFEAFYADMGPRPNGMTIERRNNSAGYSKANCYWATPTEQTRNRRNAINVTLNGVTKPLKVWCDELGVNYSTAHRKLRREGHSPAQVFA